MEVKERGKVVDLGMETELPRLDSILFLWVARDPRAKKTIAMEE